jgi:hypothetical protein
LALAAVFGAGSAAFAIQTQVMIQGYLTNGSGTPYTTAQATEFRIYQGGNAATAGTGTLYYDETATITPSASGVFNYPLGSGTPTVPFLVVGTGGTIANVLSTTTFDTASVVYLEISVGGIAVLPRLQMLGTPYAALAGTSENLKPTNQPLITTNYLQASSGTFTASGNNQASIVTSSGIVVNAGGVTAPYFNGTFYGTVVGGVSGGAGNVAAANVTPGTFGAGVLIPPQNVVGGVASTNTANTFPLVQTFPGGVVSNSESVTNGVTAASGTFTASGPNQASIVTSSGIIVNGGGVTAPFFNGMLIGSVSGGAGSVAAGSVTPGTFGAGVLIPPQNVVGGVASTNTANTFPLVQTFSGGVVSNSESVTNGVTAASGTFTASGPNQASIVTSSGIIVNSGGVTASYVSATNLYGNGAGVYNVTAAAVSGANVTGTVAVLNGGTGATTAAGAQASLGVPSTAGAGASGTWGINITGSAASAGGSPPIGSIILYAGTDEPVGWIECNGRSMSQTGTSAASWGTFNTPPLFAAIGTVWGSAGAGLFNGPDFRGIFPRGWNHGKSSSFSDPDAASRVAQYASGAAGDSIGSYETDQLRSHTHTYLEGIWPGGVTAGGFNGSSGNMGSQPTGASGGNETRPMNASVMYIMRVQ